MIDFMLVYTVHQFVLVTEQLSFAGMLRSCTYCYNLLSQAHRFSVLNKANNATSFTSEHEGFHDVRLQRWRGST